MSNKKQKKKRFVIKISGEVDLFTINKEEAIKQVENAIEDLEWDTGLDSYLDIDEDRIELDLDKKLEIDIISKAFNMTPKGFIDFVLNKELDYIKYLFELMHPKEELEEYYEREINIDELKKLILTEEVL